MVGYDGYFYVYIRDLPELTLSEFVGADSANNYNWIHFEVSYLQHCCKLPANSHWHNLIAVPNRVRTGGRGRCLP